ncbi:MAG: DUF3822 family protein [Prevotellaceae bacterium]|jgi:hypothetical protein|nr:DUF3822 family protein [Prevotellaceae bacterium]
MLDFVDKKFNSNKASKYKLSIQISLDGFLFSIFDANDICVVAKKINADNINNIFASEPLLTQKYSAVNCIVVTQKSTLVPNNLFDKNKSSEYLKFVCNISDEKIFSQKIKKIGAHCVFAIDKNIYETVKKYQPQTEFYHQSIPLINSALGSFGKNIFVFFDSKTIDIIANNNEKLLLQNSYKTENTSDAIYFVAAVKEQLDIVLYNIFLSGKAGKRELEDFLNVFKQAKLEENKNQTFAAIDIKDVSQLLLLEKLNKCV